jgi:hypothetical protein
MAGRSANEWRRLNGNDCSKIRRMTKQSQPSPEVDAFFARGLRPSGRKA